MVQVHAEIGHLPMLLHPDPKRALVVGLGGGVTAGAVSTHQTTVDVVELAHSVVSAAPYFSHVNFDVLRRPNVRLRVDDGRNHLLLTSERYDVVTADIIQPVHAGAFAGPGDILTDDRPRLEFHRSLRGSRQPIDLSSVRRNVSRHVR
jgi:spermidine synthase